MFLIINKLSAAYGDQTWHEHGFCFFLRGRSSAPAMENPCGRSIYGGNHHHLLPFYSAGSQDRQVSVNRS